MGSLRKKRRIPYVFLALAALLVPAGVAWTGRTYAGVDLPTSYLPHAELIRRGVLETGTLPLWDFHQFGGTPFLGNLLDGVFYPPNILFLIFPVFRAFELLIALHLALTAFGVYRLMRSYRLPREACALAGCTATLSLTMMARVGAGHYGIVVTLAHAPLLLYLIRRVVLKQGLVPMLLLALFSAAVLSAGHPPFVYQLALLAALFAAVELLAIRHDRSRLFRAMGFLAGSGLLAALLSAILLLPAWEVRQYASRGSLVAYDLESDRKPDMSWLPRDFVSFWIPFYPRDHFLRAKTWATYYWHEKAVYAGLIPLLCTAFALCRPSRKGPLIFFAAVSFLALAESMAYHLPVHQIAIAVLPGYSAFRVPSRGVWICGLAVPLLSGIGLARWSTVSPAVRFRFLGAMGALGCLLSIVLTARFGFHAELALFLLLLVLAGTLLWAASRFPQGGMVAVFLFSILELGAQSATIIPTAPVGSMGRPPWYLSRLGPDPSAYRVLEAGGLNEGYGPAVFGVRQIDGAGYPILESTRLFYTAAWDSHPDKSFDGLLAGRTVKEPLRLDLLNVGWLLWNGASPEPGLLEVARQGDCVLYRRPTARSYAFAGADPVEVLRGTNRITAHLRLAASETLVVSESWMPGWCVLVNGKSAEVVPYQGVVLGVRLPAGEHHIEFTYLPGPFRTGRVISLLAFLGTLTALFAALLVHRRRRSEA